MQTTRLRHRLERELGDAALAEHAIARLGDEIVERLLTAAGDPETSPLLTYRPEPHAAEVIDSLWILAFGNRRDSAGETLTPGPVNTALADAAAAFLAARRVPLIAQWEVADVLDARGVGGVISVGPDTGDDGTTIYLSTAGVFEKGRRLAAEAGIDPGRVGVVAHADHAARCLLTAAAAGLDAVIPAGIALPADYDAESDQPWTRARDAFIPVDLMARTHLG
jgi:uncharacterized SAM-binding protein YcdF (DUF218 family)